MDNDGEPEYARGLRQHCCTCWYARLPSSRCVLSEPALTPLRYILLTISLTWVACYHVVRTLPFSVINPKFFPFPGLFFVSIRQVRNPFFFIPGTNVCFLFCFFASFPSSSFTPLAWNPNPPHCGAHKDQSYVALPPPRRTSSDSTLFGLF